jgi:phenylpropionate dioxygenase-like ring-hydroxylating dioxygenase large terminal subunit
MAYLMNTWYVAGWARELIPGKLLARRLLDHSIVMFRDSKGKPHALADRCAHRFAPLSRGKLCDGGESVECPYHGLRYGVGGVCIHNPHGGGAIPKAAAVKAFPLVEHQNALWIWMGDPDKTDRTRIPQFEFLEGENWAVAVDSMMIDANYEVESDNILDLSHTEYLHPLFASKEPGKGRPECTQEDDTVWSREFVTHEELTPFLREAFGISPEQLADRWRDVRWDAPAQMALWVGAVVSGRPREEGTSVPSAHMFTPETLDRTHYFFSVSFPRALGPMAQTLATENIAAVRGPFEFEDKPMIEAVARQMGTHDLMSLNPIVLSGDAAAVRARRVLRKLIDAEKASTPMSA